MMCGEETKQSKTEKKQTKQNKNKTNTKTNRRIHSLKTYTT